MVTYVEHGALVDEYLRQVKEIAMGEIKVVLEGLYEGEGYKIVTSRYN